MHVHTCVLRRNANVVKMLTVVRSRSSVYKYLLYCFFNCSVVLKVSIMCGLCGETKGSRVKYTNLGPCQSNDCTQTHFILGQMLSCHIALKIFIFMF